MEMKGTARREKAEWVADLSVNNEALLCVSFVYHNHTLFSTETQAKECQIMMEYEKYEMKKKKAGTNRGCRIKFSVV